MLVIQSKLIDFKTKNCIGVVCLNGNTSVSLSLEKAKELGVQDIDIIEYLNADIEEVAVNPRRPKFYANLDKSVGVLDDLVDLDYDRLGDFSDILSFKEVIYGNIFRYIDFIELDNDVSIRRALIDAEKSE